MPITWPDLWPLIGQLVMTHLPVVSVSLFCCVRPPERDLSPGEQENRDNSPARETVQVTSRYMEKIFQFNYCETLRRELINEIWASTRIAAKLQLGKSWKLITLLLPQAASQEKIAAAFRKFDKNGDGVIDWDEFQQVSSRNFIMMPKVCSF